jgi:hypothetical protein
MSQKHDTKQSQTNFLQRRPVNTRHDAAYGSITTIACATKIVIFSPRSEIA